MKYLTVHCLPSHNPYFNRWFSAISEPVSHEISQLRVTILILIDGFLQSRRGVKNGKTAVVTILILIDGFLQYCSSALLCPSAIVTILILIDGFLQSYTHNKELKANKGHNPYFNRWFSAI